MTRKNPKILYYIKQLFYKALPDYLLKRRAQKLLSTYQEVAQIEDRVNYYLKITQKTKLPSDAIYIENFNYVKPSTYYYDLKQYLRAFPGKFRFKYLFGDIIKVPKTATIVKSRPISGNNQNAVIMNLNKIRHFIFANDKIPFEKKQNTIVWRGNVLLHQHNRQAFLNSHFGKSNMNIGHVNDYADNKWKVKKMSINQQLKYKFILSIEGNDVASNLKWIMSSNSLCFMCQPQYETWFMEGTLIPDYHYVLIKDDFSDLEQKIAFYSKNKEEALNIIKNANEYTSQFKNKKNEHLISLLVLERYLKLTN